LKYCQPITIAYALSPDSYRAMIAYRAMLEYYSHCVTAVRLDSEDAVLSFFRRPPPAALTMLLCHGWGESEADAVLSLDVARQINRVEYKTEEWHLTPLRWGQIVGQGAGIFLNTACWSGKLAFARPVLAAGYDAYVAPEKTSDCTSQYQFIATFVGI
jgi:hypothetical protein